MPWPPSPFTRGTTKCGIHWSARWGGQKYNRIAKEIRAIQGGPGVPAQRADPEVCLTLSLPAGSLHTCFIPPSPSPHHQLISERGRGAPQTFDLLQHSCSQTFM